MMRYRQAVWMVPLVGLVVLLSGGGPVGAGAGPVRLQTADPSCPDGSGNIYVDCGNGTVTDNRTGLVWLEDANCFGSRPWDEAVDLVANLADIPPGSVAEDDDCGLADGSSPGEWRLPTAAEWETMVSDALGVGGDPDCTYGNSPTITNDAGTACWVAGPSSFVDVQKTVYWSSTFYQGDVTSAWRPALDEDGSLFGGSKGLFNGVWPVRGGQ